MNVIEFTPLAVGDYVMPPWAQALGWLMAVASVAAIIPYAIYHIWSSYNNPEYDGVTFWRVSVAGLFVESPYVQFTLLSVLET